jgi:cytochrome c
MFTRSLILTVLMALPAAAAETPNLGQPITAAEAAAWDISIMPDGTGLPPGRGTVARGQEVYEQKCLSCHNEKGGGTPADRLVGGQGTLKGDQRPIKTVGSYWPYATTLFDYIRRAMPLLEPQSLTAEEVYAVSAYILHLNGIVGEKAVMDAKSLPRVKMPNAGNFYIVYPDKIK